MRKKNYFFYIEFLLWFIIISSITLFLINNSDKITFLNKEHEVVFKDVDSLAIGSPVRLMGIKVGHVKKLIIDEDKIKVRFIITKRNLKIPEGAHVSIEFTGLAGSKSLEILPPAELNKAKNQYIVYEPIRVNSLTKIQLEIMESILGFSKSIKDSFGDKSHEQIIKEIGNINNVTKNIETGFGKIRINTEKLNDNLASKFSNINDFLDKKNANLDSINAFLEKNTSQIKSTEIVQMITNWDRALHNKLKKIDYPKINKELKKVNKQTTKAKTILKDQCKNQNFFQQIIKKLKDLSLRLSNIKNFLNRQDLGKTQSEAQNLKEFSKELSEFD